MIRKKTYKLRFMAYSDVEYVWKRLPNEIRRDLILKGVDSLEKILTYIETKLKYSPANYANNLEKTAISGSERP